MDSRLLQQFRAAADRDSMVRDEWLQRFETAIRALPDRHPCQWPTSGSLSN
jgi:hypothetical protein